MRYVRCFGAWIATMLLVVATGCGGDDNKETKKDSDARGSGPAVQRAGAAMTSASATAGGTEKPSPAAIAGIDVAYVLPEHFAAAVIHPRRLAEWPLVAEQLKDPQAADSIKKLGIAPEEVDQVVLLLSMVELRPGRPEPMPTIVARFTHDVDAKQILEKLPPPGGSQGPPKPAAFDPRATAGPLPALNNQKEQQKIEESQLDGKTVFALSPAEGILAFAPKPDMIVVAHKSVLQKLIAGGYEKGLLAERLQKADADDDVVLAISPASQPNLDAMIADAGPMPPPLEAFVGALKTIHGATIILRPKGELLLSIAVDAKDGAAADKVEKLLKDSLKMARDGLAMAKGILPPDVKPVAGPLVKLADEALGGAKIEKHDDQVTAAITRPANFDEVLSRQIEPLKKLMRAQGEAARQINNMKQIALALINYEQEYETFPAAAATAPNGKAKCSWRVMILRYTEDFELYKAYHFDEPWDSPHNLEVAKKMPEVYRTPGHTDDGKTSIMVFTGKDTPFDDDKGITAAKITDGLSHTILAVEAGPDKAVPWTKPEDLPFDPANPLAALGQIPADGFIAAMCDGGVHRLKVDNATLKALITPAGGEKIDMRKTRGDK